MENVFNLGDSKFRNGADGLKIYGPTYSRPNAFVASKPRTALDMSRPVFYCLSFDGVIQNIWVIKPVQINEYRAVNSLIIDEP